MFGSTLEQQARIERARAILPELADVEPPHAWLETLTAAAKADQLRLVRAAGAELWNSHCATVQSGTGDDRHLYWHRLIWRQQLQATLKGRLSTYAIQGMTDAFELAARGLPMTPATSPVAGEVQLLVTGFDPFHLDQHTDQSNPSGLAALALHGLALPLTTDGTTAARFARVTAAVMPVSFSAFDAGIVEQSFAPPLLAAARARRHQQVATSTTGGTTDCDASATSYAPDAIVTISMGREQFDLERFPGRRRSSDALDNDNRASGGTLDRPVIPRLDGAQLAGPEFVEFSLPAAAMCGAHPNDDENAPDATRPAWRVNDNRNISYGPLRADGGVEHVTHAQPHSIAELPPHIAVSGSGGGYLSNEIAYRALLLRDRYYPDLAVGHIHTPKVAGFDLNKQTAIVAQIRQLLTTLAAAL